MNEGFGTFGVFGNRRKPTNGKPRFFKNEEAFASGNGVCYVDEDGNEYGRSDVASVAFSEDGTEALFEELCGKSPEKTAEGSFRFKKCGRCGNYVFGSGESLFGFSKEFICGRCTPLRTDGRIGLWSDPYDDDRKFFGKRTAEFRPGITTLVGCNGAGKTTLLRNVAEKLKERGIPHLLFDNLGSEGGFSLPERFLGRAVSGKKIEGFENEKNPLAFAVSAWSSSEGERIGISFAGFLNGAAEKMRRNSGYGEFWLLADALDSGLSVDVIDLVKKALAGLCRTAPEGVRTYVVLSSNSYEMSEGTNCFSVEKMRYVGIKSYHAFRKAVYSSLAWKEKRDEVLDAKAEIESRPYEFSFMEEKDSGRFSRSEFKSASLKIGDYEMTAEPKRGNSETARFSLIERTESGIRAVSCRGAEEPYLWGIRKESLEKTMLSYLRRKIFLEERRRKRKDAAVQGVVEPKDGGKRDYGKEEKEERGIEEKA